MLLFKTFGRYLTQRFLRAILSVFGTFFFLIATLDFVELMRRAGDSPTATTPSIIQLALFRAPSVAEQIFPFAVLFGGMFALLTLSRKLELVVARSVGISAWQFLQPAALVAGLVGLVSIGIYNPVAAELKQRATALEASLFASAASTGRPSSARLRPWTEGSGSPRSPSSPSRRMAASANASRRGRRSCIAAIGNCPRFASPRPRKSHRATRHI
jgi:lipopolysaccharide export LptBFGC system permease protein LptF